MQAQLLQETTLRIAAEEALRDEVALGMHELRSTAVSMAEAEVEWSMGFKKFMEPCREAVECEIQEIRTTLRSEIDGIVQHALQRAAEFESPAVLVGAAAAADVQHGRAEQRRSIAQERTTHVDGSRFAGTLP